MIDSLHVLAETSAAELPAFLSSLLSPSTSLVATYHTDVPISVECSSPYAPSPLTLLKFLSTTLMTPHSLQQVLARKEARDRSLAEPTCGLAGEAEGVLAGLAANDHRGVVVEMEYRRKSGTGVSQWFFVPSRSAALSAPGARTREQIILLEDHPLYGASERVKGHAKGIDVPPESPASTFELGLTDKQRRDRDGVVLPYFDAQKAEGGPGDGGRILYEMGFEDDFDEEEDEI